MPIASGDNDSRRRRSTSPSSLSLASREPVMDEHSVSGQRRYQRAGLANQPVVARTAAVGVDDGVVRPDQVSLGVLVTAVPRDTVEDALVA
jgi:hypothetical protein